MEVSVLCSANHHTNAYTILTKKKLCLVYKRLLPTSSGLVACRHCSECCTGGADALLGPGPGSRGEGLMSICAAGNARD